MLTECSSLSQTSLALFSFCLACLLVTTLAENAICQGECMVLSNCNEEGPLIRFPFKLKDQPDHCGYPGFVLSCTEKKQTLLDLPCSVKLLVKKMNYTTQAIRIWQWEKKFNISISCVERIISCLEIILLHLRTSSLTRF